jgi:hypothetical protein
MADRASCLTDSSRTEIGCLRLSRSPRHTGQALPHRWMDSMRMQWPPPIRLVDRTSLFPMHSLHGDIHQTQTRTDSGHPSPVLTMVHSLLPPKSLILTVLRLELCTYQQTTGRTGTPTSEVLWDDGGALRLRQMVRSSMQSRSRMILEMLDGYTNPRTAEQHGHRSRELRISRAVDGIQSRVRRMVRRRLRRKMG